MNFTAEFSTNDCYGNQICKANTIEDLIIVIADRGFDFIDGMQDSDDSILDNVSALKNLDDQMMEYYGNTLNLANEELSKYTNHMKNLTSVLEHYSSIITLLGKDKDYTRVLEVLNGTAQTKKNNFELEDTLYMVLSSISGKGIKKEPIFVFRKRCEG